MIPTLLKIKLQVADFLCSYIHKYIHRPLRIHVCLESHMCVFHSVQWYAELLWLSSQFEVQSLLRLGNLVSQMQNTLKK